VIEYTEISKSMAEACYADDQLMYNEGNILNFMIHVETLKDVVLS
jgi:UDP-N-acetylglucosamine/UDP-N-acetylgalactosamine diphosphorylase